MKNPHKAMGSQFKNIRFLLGLILSLTAPLFLFGQTSSDEPNTIPRSEGPLEVRIGYSIINISNINDIWGTGQERFQASSPSRT